MPDPYLGKVSGSGAAHQQQPSGSEGNGSDRKRTAESVLLRASSKLGARAPEGSRWHPKNREVLIKYKIDRLFSNYLRITLWGIAVFHSVVFASFDALSEEGLAWPVLQAAMLTVASSIVITVILHAQWIKPQHARWIFLPVGAAMVLTSVVYIFSYSFGAERIEPLIYAAILQIALGFILVDLSLYLLLVLPLFAVMMVGVSALPSGNLHAGVLVCAATVISLVSFWKRGMVLRRYVGLVLMNKARRIVMLEVQAQLREALDKAEEAARSKSRFLANTTHELQTPLSGVLGMLDLLSSSRLDEHQREWVGAAEMAASALSARINDILTMSDLEKYKLHLSHRPFDPLELARSIVRLMQPPARAKGLSLISDLPEALGYHVVGDRRRIGQILIHLCDNAIRYTQKGQVKISLKAEEGPYGAHLAFSVDDTGKGIAPKELSRLFTPFERGLGEHDASAPGSGLGLAISSHLADHMGGSLTGDSTVGVGSHFALTLTLPVDLAHTAARPHRRSHEQRQSEEAAASSDIGAEAAGVREQTQSHNPNTLLEDTSELQALHIKSLRESSLVDSMGARLRTRHEPEQVAPPTIDARDVSLAAPAASYSASMAEDTGLEGVSCSNDVTSATLTATQGRIPPMADDIQGSDMHTSTGQPKHKNARSNVNILVAEDTEINRMLIKHMLGRTGWSLTFADTGAHCLELFGDGGDYDIILMDIRMPVMDGMEACRRLREMGGLGANVPIVALTANAYEADATVYRDIGMDAVVGKPIDGDLLRQTVIRFVGPKALPPATQDA